MKLYFFERETLRYVPAINVWVLMMIMSFIAAVAYVIGRHGNEKIDNDPKEKVIFKTEIVYDTIHPVTIVNGTYYNVGENAMTADGSSISDHKISSEGIKWVALSRDLLKRWGGEYEYGDTINIWHPNKLLSGQWVIHDCMNSRFTNKIDFLIPESMAKEFPGLTKRILISKSNIVENE